MHLSARERAFLSATVAFLFVWLAIQIWSALLGLLAHIGDVLLIFLAAWALAYLLLPLVAYIERRTPLGRAGSVVLVYLAIAVVLALVLVLAVPPLAGQLTALGERGPEFGERARLVVLDIQDRLRSLGIRADLVQLYGTVPQRLAEQTGAFAANALAVVAATGAVLFNVSLVLIIAFFMLLDGDRLWSRLLGALGPELRSEAELLRRSADRSFGGFLRASLVLGAIYGVAQFAILAPLGVPFAGVVSVVAGAVMIVPFFGPVIAVIPVFVATVLGAPSSFVPVFVLTMALQQVVLNFVGPRIMAGVVGIHPLFVFFAILIGARVAGFWGVLLAVPVAGIVSTFAYYVYEVARGRRARTQAHL